MHLVATNNHKSDFITMSHIQKTINTNIQLHTYACVYVCLCNSKQTKFTPVALSYNKAKENIHTVHALLCALVTYWPMYPYPSRLLHWRWGNRMIILVSVKQISEIWQNMGNCISCPPNSQWYNHSNDVCIFYEIKCTCVWMVVQVPSVRTPTSSRAGSR